MRSWTLWPTPQEGDTHITWHFAVSFTELDPEKVTVWLRFYWIVSEYGKYGYAYQGLTRGKYRTHQEAQARSIALGLAKLASEEWEAGRWERERETLRQDREEAHQREVAREETRKRFATTARYAMTLAHPPEAYAAWTIAKDPVSYDTPPDADHPAQGDQ